MNYPGRDDHAIGKVDRKILRLGPQALAASGGARAPLLP